MELWRASLDVSRSETVLVGSTSVVVGHWSPASDNGWIDCECVQSAVGLVCFSCSACRGATHVWVAASVVLLYASSDRSIRYERNRKALIL